MSFLMIMPLVALSSAGSFAGGDDAPLFNSVQAAFSPEGRVEILLTEQSKTRNGVVVLIGLTRNHSNPSEALLEGEVLNYAEAFSGKEESPRWEIAKLNFPFLGILEFDRSGGIGLPFVLPVPAGPTGKTIHQTAPQPSPLSQRATQTGPVDLVISQLSTGLHQMTNACDGFDPMLPDVSCQSSRKIDLYATVWNVGSGTVPANLTDVSWRWEAFDQSPGSGGGCLGVFPNANTQIIGLPIPAWGTFVSLRGFYAGPCDPGCPPTPAVWRHVTCFTARVDTLGTLPETGENNNAFVGLPLQLCDHCGTAGGGGGGMVVGRIVHDA